MTDKDNIRFFTLEATEVMPAREFVILENEDGSTTSYLKSTWDELQAQKELGGTL